MASMAWEPTNDVTVLPPNSRSETPACPSLCLNRPSLLWVTSLPSHTHPQVYSLSVTLPFLPGGLGTLAPWHLGFAWLRFGSLAAFSPRLLSHFLLVSTLPTDFSAGTNLG